MIISNYKHSHDGSTKSYTSFVYISFSDVVYISQDEYSVSRTEMKI